MGIGKHVVLHSMHGSHQKQSWSLVFKGPKRMLLTEAEKLSWPFYVHF